MVGPRRSLEPQVVSDVDIWRAANILIKSHAEDAALVAAQRADELLAEGDVEGERVFKMILEVVRELQRKKPQESERVN
jgi:hypothetical protein